MSIWSRLFGTKTRAKETRAAVQDATARDVTLTCKRCGKSFVLGKNAGSITSEEAMGMAPVAVGRMQPSLSVCLLREGVSRQELEEARSSILRLGPLRGWDCYHCSTHNSWSPK